MPWAATTWTTPASLNSDADCNALASLLAAVPGVAPAPGAAPGAARQVMVLRAAPAQGLGHGLGGLQRGLGLV